MNAGLSWEGFRPSRSRPASSPPGSGELTAAMVAELFLTSPREARLEPAPRPARVRAARRPEAARDAAESGLYRFFTKATTALLVVSLFAGWLALSLALSQKVGYQSYTILSGSMRPGMPVGSLVFDRWVPADEVQVGDVISFHPVGHPELTLTHRVHRLVVNPPDLAPGTYIVTKGDANAQEDPGYLARRGSFARAVFWVPVVGYVTAWLQQTAVKVVLLVLPLLLAASLLLSSIWQAPADD